MVVYALLTMGVVLTAVLYGLHTLRKEYRPLLRALCRREEDPEGPDGDGEEEGQ